MRLARFQLASLLVLLLFVPAAHGAPTQRRLGQTTQAGKEISPCNCSAWQFGDLGTALGSYGIGFDGVIVQSGVRVGAVTDPVDSFQPQSVHETGANAGTVTGQGAVHNLDGLDGTLPRFFERFLVGAGDVLGARFNTGSFFIENTSATFSSTNTADEVAQKSPAIGAGEGFTGSSNATKVRVNVEAVLESDEDHDGYGDVSQDLCPGSPIGASACSGALFGSDFQGLNGSFGGAGSDSLFVQKTLRGASTAVPGRGVVVRWRVIGTPGATPEFQLRVLSPNGTGGFTVTASSAVGTVTKNLNYEAGAIASFPTRLPIPAGGYVALATGPTFTQPSLVTGVAGGSALTKLADGGDGTTYSTLPTTFTQEMGYDADIEPDADGDGFGDVTQDACPNAPSTQTAPCPLPPTMSGPPATPSTPSKPTISGFKAVPKSFQIKLRGGTKLKLTLSKAAKVTFTFGSPRSCPRMASAASACRSLAKSLGSFSKSLPSGRSSVAFSGRIKGKALAPGSYRVTALASAAGLESAPARTMVTVLAPPTGTAK